MEKEIPSESLSLLRRVMLKHAPEMVPQSIEKNPAEMSEEERSQLIEILSLEFSETGLDSNDEPNERGLALEELLDRINRYNIKNRYDEANG